MLAYNNFSIKALFILLLALNIGLPINQPIDLLFIIIGIFIVFFCKLKNFSRKNYFFILILILIPILIGSINKKNIYEYHSSFLSKADIQNFSEFLPKSLINKINKKYNDNFDFDRALNSSHIFNNKSQLDNFNFIEKKYSFSNDNFLFRNIGSRVTNEIDFTTRENLRISQFNIINYNFPYDKEFRRIIPYYVLFKIPSEYYGSKVCSKGNTYYAYSNDEIDYLKNINFINSKNNCIYVDKDFKYLYFFGFSINNNDNLEMELVKKNINFYIYFLILLLKFFLIFLFYSIFFKLKRLSKYYYFTFILTVISSFVFIYFKDYNILFGLRYFRGGADGLFHEFQGNEIIRNLYEYNFYNAFRGGEDVYYFMPGLRYFIAISKIIFGDTSYGYVIICFLLPIFLFELFKNLISEKISFFILILFLILPIFENMGFGYFNYIHQIVRNHPETLSIMIIIYCLSKISAPNFLINLNNINVFWFCFLLSFATFCRPNFLPTTTIIFIYILYLSINKNYILSLLAIIGYSFVFLGLLHNIYFGDNFSLFTKSNVHFVFNDIFQNLNNANAENNMILSQLLKWNPITYIHRLVILFLVIFFFLGNKKNLIISILFSSAIIQHIVLLLTHPDGRYAYLAWMLTLICFFYYLFGIYFKKFK